MKVGIITSNLRSPYVLGLIENLLPQLEEPLYLIIAKKSIYKTLIRYYKRQGLVGVLMKTLKTSYSKENKKSEIFRDNDANESLTRLDTELEGRIRVKKVVVNSKEAVKLVRNESIDIIINAGGGIYSNSIIRAPKIGILNAHMAYLPGFRGMNVLEWSLFYQYKLGVTLHLIDRGIDTGDILLFKEILAKPGDTIESLRQATMNINISLMSEGIKLLEEGKIVRSKQKKEEGKQYFFMHNRLKKYVIRHLQSIGS